MRKNQVVAFVLVVVFLVSSVAGLVNVSSVRADPNYDRTDTIGILIAAWTMDDHGITPAQCKSMLDNLYTNKGVVIQSIKITYGYVPENGAVYTAGRIGVWVDYFDDYYNSIYVASRSVFHIERKLNFSEVTYYYYTLANVLSSYEAVKGFLGEEEPEAKQVDPYNGDPEGNNLAYADADDMMAYIANLHDTWAYYSDIPFSFESIPMEYSDSGRYYNPDCWFFDTWEDPVGVDVDDYWDWVDTNQDFYGIDEWRFHWGVQEWADHIDYYNTYIGTRKIIIGETFGEFNGDIDSAYTQELCDAFYHSWVGGSRNDLQFAFWWELAGSEYVPSENPYAPEPYIYFDGGYKGHCWAFLNMQAVSAGGYYGSGVASAMTYSDSYSDYAQAVKSASFYTDSSKTEFMVKFNLDVSAERGYGGYENLLGYWGNGAGVYFAITAVYDSCGDINIKYYYPAPYGMTYQVFDHKIVPNCANWASIKCQYPYVYFWFGYEEDDATTHNDCLGSGSLYYYSVGIVGVQFGAMGGAKTKLYVGAISVRDWTTDTLLEDSANFESGNMNGWSLYFSEPSCVQGSSLLVPSNGAQWMLARLRYNVDY